MLEQRRVVTGVDGSPMISYLERDRSGAPWADRVEIISTNAFDYMMREMSGWIVTCADGVAEQLIARGAQLRRRSHRMSRDLSVDPPPEHWRGLSPASPLRLASCDRPAEDLLPAWRAAYAMVHSTDDDATLVRDRLAPLLDGTLHGPVLPASALVISGDGRVVAGAVLNLVEGVPPWGGPWLTDMFRHPDPAYAGLGTMLLRLTMARTASDGNARLGLAVTDGNPARDLYERHGFRTVDSPVSVLIP